MTGNVVKRVSALRDLDDIAEYIQRRSGPERAIRFLREADSCFTRIARMPGIGARYEEADPAFGEIRYLPISSRFKNYVAFYKPVADGMEVLRVLHGARDIRGILAEDFGAAEGPTEDDG